VKAIASAKIITTALCITALFGCQKGAPGSTTETKKEGQVVAEVNGSTITTGDFSSELKNLPEYLKSMAETPQGRKEMLDTMVIRELILQQAAKDGLDKSPEVARKLEDLKKRLIVESFLKKRVETDVKVGDDDLKKFYEQNKDKFKTGEQIRASHILSRAKRRPRTFWPRSRPVESSMNWPGNTLLTHPPPRAGIWAGSAEAPWCRSSRKLSWR